MRPGFYLLSLCLALAACDNQEPRSPGDSEPSIENAWIRAAPPSAQMLAAYMEIINPGTKEMEIVSAQCAGFDSTEIHRSEIIDDVARMTRQNSVTLAAGAITSFAPGGLHLMLNGPVNPVAAGMTVSCTVSLANGLTLAEDFTVREAGSADASHAGHDHED
jgi:copper(I)-binding protein